MSGQKAKNPEREQRGSSLTRSSSNNKNSNNSKQIEDKKNDIKRKLLEQMQADLRQHPEGQAKTYETLENAKKLKKILIDSIYSNRNPLHNLNHDSSNINNNSQNQESSQRSLKVVKANYQFQNGIQEKKQRSSSVQKDYPNQLSKHQQYSHLNSIPNDTKNQNISYQQVYDNANNYLEQKQQQQNLEQNEKATINSAKKQVTFNNPSLNNNNQIHKNQHQCFHKEGCSKNNKSHCSQNQNGNHNHSNGNQNSINEDLNDRDKDFQEKNQQNNQEINLSERKQNNSSQKKNESARNSPQPKNERPSSQKEARSYSASNSGKKSDYKMLIESEEEKQEIFKKIQSQKEEINSEIKNKKSQQSIHQIQDSRKPPQIPQSQNQLQKNTNKIAQNNLNQKQESNNNLKNGDNNIKTYLSQNQGDIINTIQKQRSLSTQQYSHSATQKQTINNRSSSKGHQTITQNNKQSDLKHRESDKNIKQTNSQNIQQQKLYQSNSNLDKSFENDNQKREQTIIDLQRIIERMRIENNSKLAKLETKKLEEQYEKDKLYEKQMLDLKLQQKNIYVLQQEKDLIQEEKDQFENKYNQLQQKSKHFEKIRLELEDEIQRQVLNIQELKSQINNHKSQYNELNKKYLNLKKDYDNLENEKNKINNSKIKAEQDQQQKNTQFQCLNQQNFDLTIEFERKNKEHKYQVTQLIDKLNHATKNYEESSKNLEIYQNKFRTESQQKEQLRVELKLIQAQVSENEELKRKIIQKDNKLEELESVVDDLKRKIRNNLNIDMKHNQNKQMIEKIVEKPIFIEKKVEVEKSSHNSNLAQEYKAQVIKCQEDVSDIKHKLMSEQELNHQRMLECEAWKNHAQNLEDKYNNQIHQFKQEFEIERKMLDKEIREKDNHNNELKNKIKILLEEVETLTHKNIDKNRQIANEIINQNTILQINDSYHQIPTYFPASSNTHNQSYLSYING